MTKPLEYVLITHDPHTTAHFWEVTSEVFRGTCVECDNYLIERGQTGHLWLAKYWDAGKG